MFSTRLKHRLIYLVMSLFIAWHTLAIIVAPAPEDSAMAQALRNALLQPYLSFFRLDNAWDFFAPNVENGSQFRYVIEDKDGTNHTFVPADELSWFHPNYFWFRSWYYAIMDEPERYVDIAAAVFCRKHASLHPAAVTFLDVHEEDFTQEDYLAGKHRLDPEFLKENILERVQCPGG
jgi:hypothetical protein